MAKELLSVPMPVSTHIQPFAVDLILQYISPPSNLEPIPSHLISKSLLQRHHFLDISTKNPSNYLSWPSNNHSEPVELLESQSTNQDPSSYQFRYTFDGDFTYAHVGITPDHNRGVRLVFQWDVSTETWRFHDLNVMPFPIDAKPSPQEASNPTQTKFNGTPLIVSLDSPTSERGDDDSYWNSYGGDHSGSPDVSRQVAHTKESNSEDAYWAQYSSVHGSADSTVPSPMPDKGFRKPQYIGEDANPNDPNVPANVVLTIPTSTVYPGRTASPEALAHILSTLVRDSPSTPPSAGTPLGILPEYGSSPSHSATLLESGQRSSRRRSLEMDIAKLKHPRPVSLNGLSSIMRRGGDAHHFDSGDESDAALTETIRGVYRLWKAQTKNSDKEQFLRVVRDVVESS